MVDRAVKVARNAPVGLVESVATGDRRVALTSLRDELARRLVDAERDVPGLARQLLAVLSELDSLPNPAEESTVDDLASKRAARIAEAEGGKRPASRVKRGS